VSTLLSGKKQQTSKSMLGSDFLVLVHNSKLSTNNLKLHLRGG
jgi:hypothetical protein